MPVIIKSYVKKCEKKIMDDIESGMGKAVLIVENQAKKNVSKTAPQHPQRQSGRLIGSINSKVSKEGNEIIGEIGTNVYYGKYLEYGTSHHPAYPWLFPAVEMRKNDIKNALKGRSFTID